MLSIQVAHLGHLSCSVTPTSPAPTAAPKFASRLPWNWSVRCSATREPDAGGWRAAFARRTPRPSGGHTPSWRCTAACSTLDTPGRRGDRLIPYPAGSSPAANGGIPTTGPAVRVPRGCRCAVRVQAIRPQPVEDTRHPSQEGQGVGVAVVGGLPGEETRAKRSPRAAWRLAGQAAPNAGGEVIVDIDGVLVSRTRKRNTGPRPGGRPSVITRCSRSSTTAGQGPASPSVLCCGRGLVGGRRMPGRHARLDFRRWPSRPMAGAERVERGLTWPGDSCGIYGP
ncbi:hypothetical protein EES42_30825 [Streptomyces sp. ADI95-17]|nr:hypothetical protein EES42_30825 [Streptomyces sp. ADI95-17]